MFQYNSTKEMKEFLDKYTDCKTKENKAMLEQIKHYLDWPLQLYALQEAEYLLRLGLRGKFDNLIIPKKIISRFLVDTNKCVKFTIEFLAKTPLKEDDNPFHPNNVIYEYTYSVHDNQSAFDIRFINVNGRENETKFTCQPDQNIIQCLREFHNLFENFKKENPEIKEVLKVMYVGDTSYVSEEKNNHCTSDK